MLSPQDIADKVFEKAVFGGYEMTGVDEFLESVSENYNALYKENAILKGKLKVLVEKVEEYRSTEDAMRMALLTAQRMGEDLLADANKHRDEILQNAENEEKSRIAEMERKLAGEEMRLTAAVKETTKFVNLAKTIMQKHSEFLSKLENTRKSSSPQKPPAEKPAAEKKSAPPAPKSESAPLQDEESIQDAANQIIGGVLASLKDDANALPVQTAEYPEDFYDDEDTKVYGTIDEDDSSQTKFDLENLKFGKNFSNEQ
ncbi:MAG: DivIVA domain-containing protein [Oscillospiraceae bacterium]|nr:DivIVA domain-containing protein [Oscillospiraceae bacterium]